MLTSSVLIVTDNLFVLLTISKYNQMEPDGLPLMVMRPPVVTLNFDLWPKNLISMSPGLVHMWPNSRKVSYNTYKDIVFTLFFFFACCDLDLWSWNLISTSMNPNTVKPLMLACPLFRKFRETNKTAKLKGVNINCRPKLDDITTIFRIVWV